MAKLKTYWICKGAVTDPSAYDYHVKKGHVEWQFSDGPSGQRSESADYLTLEAGLSALAPAIFIWEADK